MTMDLPELPNRGGDWLGGGGSGVEAEPVVVPPAAVAKADDDVGQALAFLRWRFPEDLDGGVLSLLSKDGPASGLEVVGHYPVEDAGLRELAARAVGLSVVADTWVSLNALGGYPPPKRKGGEVGLRYLAGLHEDIDKGIEKPLEFLDGLGEWRPSYVVESGHGVHAYWLYDRVVDLAAEADGEVARLAEARGRFRLLGSRWHAWLEQVADAEFDDTTNLDRIMRLPGTWNRKRQGAVPVRVARPFDGRRFRPSELREHLDQLGVEARLRWSDGTRAWSSEEVAAAFAGQGTLGAEETRQVVERLLPVYVHRANTYQNASRSRNRALFDLAQQLNDHGVPREAAADAVLQARVMVTEYTETGELDPLTVEEVMTSIESAYQLPPRGVSRHPELSDGAREAAETGWTGAGGVPDPAGPGVTENGTEGRSDTTVGSGGGGTVTPLVQIVGERPRNRDTDRGNAEELEAFAGRRLRLVAGVDEWIVWDGTRWVTDMKYARERIMIELSRQLEERAVRAGEDERNVLLKRARSLEMSTKRDSALRYARDLLVVELGDLDADPWKLNTPGGLVDLRTGAVRRAEPEDLVTRATTAAWDPAARSELWEEILLRLIPDEGKRRWLQRWFGYCLTGLTSEKAIACVFGEADTGKSTVSGAVYAALGNVASSGYAVSWTSKVIQDNDRVNREEKLHHAIGARLCVTAELRKGSQMDAAFVKEATGGDVVDARALYAGSVNFKPQLKLLLHTNYTPRSADPALQNRLRFLELTERLSEVEKGRRLGGTDVKTFLETDPEQQAAVLAWCVEGCRFWQEEGLGKPPGHAEALRAYEEASDGVLRFVRMCLAPLDDDRSAEWVPKDFVERLYAAWLVRMEEPRGLGKNKLWEALRERGYHDIRVTAGGGSGSKVRVVRRFGVRPGVTLGELGQLVLPDED